MRNVKKQNGQAILETLIVLKVFVLFLTGAIGLAGLLFHKHWVLYNTQKALVCFAENKSKAECLYKLKRRLSVSFFKSKIVTVKNNNGYGFIKVASKVLNQSVEYKRELKWPQQSLF